jgi:RNA polymerase sigma-70 factor, ECF subfamily
MSQALATTLSPPPASSDANLAEMVRAAQANPAAFGPLYRRYVRPVHRYVCAQIGDRTAAEDITAQVFVDVLTSLPRYHERGEFTAWLFRIARRRIADHHRRRVRWGRREAPLDEDGQDPYPDLDAGLDLAPLQRTVLARIAQLDEDQQELIRLRFAAGLTFPEIGAILGRPADTVKMALHRLLDRLAREMEVNHVRAS